MITIHQDARRSVTGYAFTAALTFFASINLLFVILGIITPGGSHFDTVISTIMVLGSLLRPFILAATLFYPNQMLYRAVGGFCLAVGETPALIHLIFHPYRLITAIFEVIFLVACVGWDLAMIWPMKPTGVKKLVDYLASLVRPYSLPADTILPYN